MWSIVLCLIVLIEQVEPSWQIETIQASIASTVELPCSSLAIGQSGEASNLGTTVWIRDDRADIVSLDSMITVRDRRLSLLTMKNDGSQREQRILRITNVEEQDHGLYRCLRGDQILAEIFLDVLVPPRIVAYSPKHMRVSIYEGHNVQFSCTASGRPTPIVLWHVNGLSRPATVNSVSGKNASILLLRNVSRTDAGRVDCSATNILSTVNRQFLLHVKYKPIVTVPFHLSYFRRYDSPTITCRICSEPLPILFDFFRPKQTIPISQGIKDRFEEFINQTCRQLTISIYLSDPTLFGSYVCRARNSAGVAHAEFVLRELIQSTKQIKPITDRRPSTTASMIIMSSSSFIVTNANDDESSKREVGYLYEPHTISMDVIAGKNRACMSSTSFVLLTLVLLASTLKTTTV